MLEPSLYLLLLLLCLLTSPTLIFSASDTTSIAEEEKIKVSTRIELRLKNTYSKIEEETHLASFKQLIETTFDNELPRIQSLSSDSSTTYKLSHVRTRVLEQWWGKEYEVLSSSTSTRARARARHLSGIEAGKRLDLQPLIVRIIVTGRYVELDEASSNWYKAKLPTSSDFYTAIKTYFDNGGGDIMVDEYIKKIQAMFPGEAANFFTEIEEIELLEQSSIVIKKQNDADKQVNVSGLVVGSAFAVLAVLIVAAYFFIHQKKKRAYDRHVNGAYIITRQPDSSNYLPSEIDVESLGGSIVSNMYSSSFKPEKDLLPRRFSEGGSTDDNSTKEDSFIQLHVDGTSAVAGAAETNSSPSSSVAVYKDYSHTDVEKQAQARLMQYISKYSESQGEEEEEEGNEKASISASRSSSSTSSKTDNNAKKSVTSSVRTHNDESSTLVSQEASLLKNLGVTGVCREDGEDDEAKQEEEASSSAESSDHEGSTGSKSRNMKSKSISSEPKTSDDQSLHLESNEAMLLKNLGIAEITTGEEETNEEASVSSKSNASTNLPLGEASVSSTTTCSSGASFSGSKSEKQGSQYASCPSGDTTSNNDKSTPLASGEVDVPVSTVEE